MRLLQSDKVRAVTNVGIELTLPGAARMVFPSPERAEHWRERVRIRNNPEDLASILVYSATTPERICDTYRQQPDGTGAGAYTNRDLVRAAARARRPRRAHAAPQRARRGLEPGEPTRVGCRAHVPRA